MTTKNVIRITISNPRLAWKIFLYASVVLLILTGIVVAAGLPLVKSLDTQGFFVDIKDYFNSFALNADFSDILNNTSGLLDNLFAILSANLSNLLWLLGLVVFIYFILGSFVLGQLDLSIGNCIYGYMSSGSKLSFGGSLITNIGKSAKLQLAKMIISFPVDILIFAAFVLSLDLFALGAVVEYLAPFIIILGGSLLIAMRITLFCCWYPAIVVNNLGIFAGLKRGVRNSFKKFRGVFLSAFVLVIILFVLNYAFMFFTAGVALIVTVPVSVLLVYVFGFVIYFQNNGLKFYVDSGTIIVPHKIEENDDLNKLKHIV